MPATEAVAQPNSAQRALERRLGPQAVVDIDVATGTPRVIARLDGTLTGPASGAPEDVATDYVQQNLDVLGLTESDLATLQPPETSTTGAVTEVRWRQAVDGIPAADSELRVNLTRDGRVLNVLGSPASDLDPDTTPSLTPGEAVRAVQDSVGANRPLPRDSGPAGATRATEYTDGTDAELALFNGRLAWRVMLRASSTEVYDSFVDAETGRVLQKHNMVKSAAGDARVWDRFPGNGPGGAAATKNLVTLGYLTAGATTLDGPSVRTFSDLDDDDNQDAGEGISAVAGSFEFDFTPFAHASCNAAHLCAWEATAATRTANRNQNGVQAFYLANRFYKEYLEEPPINFTAANGDKPFISGDRLILHTHDGANTGPDSRHLDNANMLTPPDGTSPVMQMYLWAPDDFRAVNGGDDASILYHEYTHGLSNRLVTDAAGVGALNTAQSGAMGEAWGDWYAKDFIVNQFPQLDTAAPAQVDMGDYIDLNPHSIRRQALDCPVTGATALQCPPGFGNTGSGGFTYADFGKVNGEPEVHGDGEIWAQTLWDLRGAIGSVNARRLITQGMRLSPPEPSFLDMRNAILQADAAEGGTRRTQIWQVFANRGMGFYAATTGSIDVAPIADASMPPAGGPRGRIAGTVTDAATGAALNGVRATIGGLENGPDALSATTAGAGAFAIENVPEHEYPSFVFKAAGYDQLVTAAPVKGGFTTILTAKLRRNWAAASGGANAIGDNTYANLGCGTLGAIDQNPGAGWSTDAGGSRQLIVTLPQNVNVTGFGIDPTATCGDDEVAATRQIRIETSTNTMGAFVPAVEANLPFTDDHTVTTLAPGPGTGTNVRRVRVTLLGNFGSAFFDLSEFSVYAGPPASVNETAPPVATPRAEPPPAPVDPAPTAISTPAPSVAPLARPTFTLPRSAKRSLRFKVTCRVDCRVTAKLVVARAVARRLGLGRSRTAGTLTRSVKAGTTTLTLKLNSKAARALRSKVRSFRGTLHVGAAYPGESATSRSRLLTVKR